MAPAPERSRPSVERSRSRPGRRYPKGEQRRREILDRTVDVIAERGVEGTTLRAVAESIGVTHAAITRYFANREELFLEVLREADRRGEAELAARSSASDFATRAAQISLRTPGLIALDNPMISRAVEPGNVASRDHFAARYAHVLTEIADTLRAGQAAGIIREDLNARIAATLLLAAADGLSVQHLLGAADAFEPAMALLDSLIGTQGR